MTDQRSSSGSDEDLIAEAPSTLRQLAAKLAGLLDDDHWNNIEPYLLDVARLLRGAAQSPREEQFEEALQRIAQWADAYPLDVFPEPDLAKARALLEAGGITLGAVSAHYMRHVIKGFGEIARKALAP